MPWLASVPISVATAVAVARRRRENRSNWPRRAFAKKQTTQAAALDQASGLLKTAEAYAEDLGESLPETFEWARKPAAVGAGGKGAGGKGAGGRKKKAPKDPNRPAYAPTGYQVFMEVARKDPALIGPQIKGKQAMTKGGELWKNMSDDEKKKYNDQAAPARARYDREMKAYNEAKARAASRDEPTREEPPPPPPDDDESPRPEKPKKRKLEDEFASPGLSEKKKKKKKHKSSKKEKRRDSEAT
mmetsp:Transcript_2879/g.8536  ORF Transcript_2879/g.8536 Transcript_2879/m.8536 type:complete len:244 (+) Transcript_2879:53-784(+)